MPDHPILREATFDPAVKAYWMISTTIICVVSCVGILLLPIVWIYGPSLIGRYLERLSCCLTTRTLELRKGVINRTESTIPLEKITDLQMFQGPIMRHFGLHGFKVETAGQSSPAGSLLSVVGIVDAPAFRRAVLEQRDRLAGGDTARGREAEFAGRAPLGAPAATPADAESAAVLRDIRDSLHRIEARLGDRLAD